MAVKESLQAARNTDLLSKITSFGPVTRKLAAYRLPLELDKWFPIKTLLYMMESGLCVAAFPTTAVNPLIGIPMMAEACSGAVLETLNQAGNIAHMDVGSIEALSNGLDIQECSMTGSPMACANVFVDNAEQQDKNAKAKISNPPPEPAPAKVKITALPGIYPIGRDYFTTSPTGWKVTLDNIEVLYNGNIRVNNTWTNLNKECAHQGDCDLSCAQENDDGDAPMQLADGRLVPPIETNCTQARGQGWNVMPGETFNDWAIYPPVEDAAQPFMIIWFGMGNVDHIVLVPNP